MLIVDTIGFEPGILSADGRLPHSDQLHVIERFSLDTDGRALRRSWVAEDPLFFKGQYTGSDVVFVSDVPFQVTPCDDRSYTSPGDATRRSWPLWAAVGLVTIAAAGWGVIRWRGAIRTGWRASLQVLRRK